MKPWRIDATTSSKLDSRQVIERDAMGQWDLINPETGAKRKPIVTIASVEQYVPAVRRKKRLDDGRMVDEPLNKLKITFVGKRKYFICNQVNRKAIEAMYGTVMQAWIGQNVTLYVDDAVSFGRRRTGGLRIESKRPDGKPSLDALDEAVDEAKGETMLEARRDEFDDAAREPGED